MSSRRDVGDSPVSSTSRFFCPACDIGVVGIGIPDPAPARSGMLALSADVCATGIGVIVQREGEVVDGGGVRLGGLILTLFPGYAFGGEVTCWDPKVSTLCRSVGASVKLGKGDRFPLSMTRLGKELRGLDRMMFSGTGTNRLVWQCL